MLNGIPRILIVRLSAIGDVVRVLPALRCLREVYPDAQIDWVVEPKSADLLEGHPDLDQVLVFERSKNFVDSFRQFRNVCKKIRTNRYEMLIDFHGILKSGLIAGFSGVPERYGFSRPRSRECSYLFTNHRTRLGPEVANRIHENLALCEQFSPGSKSLDVTIQVPPHAQDEIEDYFEATFDGAKRIVAMHVPVDRAEKQWPHEYFARLADDLIADGRFDVVLTWGPGQLEDVQRVAGQCRRAPEIAPEMASLKHYAWFIHCADLYFGADTGPMHIASAMGTPVVAVFGGTDPRQHEPLRKPYILLSAEECAEDKSLVAKASVEEQLRMVSPEAAYDACIKMCLG